MNVLYPANIFLVTINMGFTLIVLAAVLTTVAGVLDQYFKIRMARAGADKWALLKGGAFNYASYHKVARVHGWSHWPVYLFWALMTIGIAALFAGVAINNGFTPRGPLAKLF
jgi:hypothetical protein